MREYLLKKDVNWAMLTEGFSVVHSQQQIFFSALQFDLKRGEKWNIKIIMEGDEFDAVLSNMDIKQEQFQDHCDIVRIQYSKNGKLAEKLQGIFYQSYQYCSKERKLKKDQKGITTIPEEFTEYLVLYTTTIKDMFLAEAITIEDKQEFKQETSNINEADYENEINNMKDDNATIIQKQMNVKIRKMDRKICERLKEIYNYRCQICGYGFREKYGVDYAEAHHIIPFVQSMNNNPENILILCPNHHRIIHKAKAIYDKVNICYLYGNELIENISIIK